MRDLIFHKQRRIEMRKLLAVFVLLFCALVAQPANAVTVWYQPTPYPAKQADGTMMPQDITIVHAWEGWLSNVYYGQTLQRTTNLQMGGAGDYELMYLKFDLTGLPQNVDQALMYLQEYAIPSPYTTIPYATCSVTSTWNLSMTWNTQPSYGTCYGWYPAPTANTWSGFWLSYQNGSPNWYNQWKNGTLANNGVMLYPQATNNNFDAFYSTLYNNYASDPLADGRRPALYLSFTPTLEIKMPLKGLQGPEKLSWLVTTEVGGYDCLGHVADGSNDPWPDTAHQGSNYFSIDFSWRNKDVNGAQVYASTDNIPVLAAADGTATVFPNDPFNGNYVVVTHGTTGFETRYLHLKTPIVVANNASVTQGTLLGYMGATGTNAIHLHFGVRYNGNGASTVPELAKVVTEGLLLKSYQTECVVDTNGVPTSRIRYYPSSNY